MVDVFLKTLPFFGLIGCGYLAVVTRFFSSEATAYLTKFVFYFALSAMLFRFSSNLPIEKLMDAQFALAYLSGCFSVYVLVTVIALVRGSSWPESAIAAQCSVIGNNGFLAVPMLLALLGEAAVAPTLFVLSIDLIVFGTLIVVSITASRQGGLSVRACVQILLGIVRNPMVMSMALGLIWSYFQLPVPVPMDSFLEILGAAATPCALFAIGASLAGKSPERLKVAVWLSAAKLVAHPLAVAFFAFYVFDVDRFAASIMVVTAAMPTAGNIFILAQHFGVAPARASATILISTLVSVFSLSFVIASVFPS